MEKNNQDQRSGDNGTNIQAGGNVTIGMSYENVRQIADDVFKVNFSTLQGEARNIAEQRATELITEYLARLQIEKTPLDAAKDPDMQYVIFTAQRDYARSGKKDLLKLLVDILAERAKAGENELKKIVLNEAIQVAPKLTSKQLNAISVRFLIANSRNHSISNTASFHNYINQHISPLCDELAKENSDYQHIEYAGCGTVNFLKNDIYTLYKANYAGVLSTGFNEDAAKTLNLNPAQRGKLIISCLRDPTKFQISAIDDEAITTISKQCGLNDSQITQTKDLQNNHLISKEALEKELTGVSHNFAELLHTWDKTGLGSLQLTTVGIALAHANIKKTIGVDLDLSVWIK